MRAVVAAAVRCLRLKDDSVGLRVFTCATTTGFSVVLDCVSCGAGSVVGGGSVLTIEVVWLTTSK